ncbi:MAG: hypothetical protein IRY89_07595 [Pseudolabrys sp.]|nr:hypothetical protein [Pseudolabrys sp.]
MWGRARHLRAGGDGLSLEACARSAGLALACSFSSAAELDAALIAARRAAGVYGPKRRRRRMLLTAAGIGAGALAVAIVTAFAG